MATTPSKVITLKNVRLSYPHLWKAQPPKDNKGKPKFGATLLIDPNAPEIALIKAEMGRVAKETFGEKWQNIVAVMEDSKKCLRDGNKQLTKDGDIQPGYAGMKTLHAKNVRQPKVVHRRPKNADGTPNLVTEESGVVYGGCYVNATVEIYAMKAKGDISNCIAATLNAVQFLRDGDAFGAGPTSAEGFDDLGDDEDGETVGAESGATDDPFAD